MFHTIITLWQQRHSQRNIAKAAGISRSAVRRAIDKRLVA